MYNPITYHCIVRSPKSSFHLSAYIWLTPFTFFIFPAILLLSMRQTKYLYSARIIGLKFGPQVWVTYAVPKCIIRTFTILSNCANVMNFVYCNCFFLLHSHGFWWNFQAQQLRKWTHTQSSCNNELLFT